MSATNGIYKSMKAAIIQSLLENWEPDWDVFAEPAYKKFIEDAQQDVRIAHSDFVLDEGCDHEVTLIAYVEDSIDYPNISRDIPLSDILAEIAEFGGVELAESRLQSSIAAFRKKINKEGEVK